MFFWVEIMVGEPAPTGIMLMNSNYNLNVHFLPRCGFYQQYITMTNNLYKPAPATVNLNVQITI
jgi:hypothetical protein